MTVRELAQDEEIIGGGSVREMSPDEEILPEKGAVERFGRGANVGIAQMLGSPVDFANIVLGVIGLGSDQPIGGSESIQRGFAALGLAPKPGEEEPDTLAGSIGRMTGASAAALVPFGAATRGLAAAKPSASVAGRITQDIAKTAVETPGRFLAGEIVSSAGAGTGGFAARQLFPDSNMASFVGEILGGITPAATVGAVQYTPTILGARYARKLAEQFSVKTGTTRAEKRLQTVARHPDGVVDEMESQLLPEAKLTPAQKTGDAGILSLERAVIESSDELTGQADAQIAEATKAIKDSIKSIGDGVPVERTAENLQAAREHLSHLVDTRMKIAAKRAEERLAAIGPKATREEANTLAREELESALGAARQQEGVLWAAIPEDIQLPTTNIKQKFQEIQTSTPRAQQEDIPAVARDMLSGSKPMGDLETISELQGLRSKLLEESRKARAAGNYNTARIADDLAAATLADMGAQRDNVRGQAGHALRAALDFSFDLNEKFTRGVVARILGTEKRGGARLPEELTLEKTTGFGGPKARVETQALLDAADTPKLRGAVEDFLLDDFQRRVVRDGQIAPGKVSQFITRYRDVLDDFPDLRTKIEAAVRSNDAAIAAQNRADGLARKLNDPKVSRAAVFLKEPVETGMERVASSQSPGKTMAELVRQALRDESGEAIKGLKTGFGDLLVNRASTRTPTEADDFVISGRTMNNLLDKGPLYEMAKSLFTPDEINRLGIIADTAERLELAVVAKPHKGGVVIDAPNYLFSLLARITGAQLGRKVASATGGGTVQTPGFFSKFTQDLLLKRVQDPARRILFDAMQDEALFKALLTGQTVITRAEEAAVKQQLNAWLLEVSREQLIGDE